MAPSSLKQLQSDAPIRIGGVVSRFPELSRLFDGAVDPVAAVDIDGGLLYCNSAFAALVGVAGGSEPLVSESWPPEHIRILSVVFHALEPAARPDRLTLPARLPSRDGGEFAASLTASRLLDGSGRDLGLVCHYRDARPLESTPTAHDPGAAARVRAAALVLRQLAGELEGSCAAPTEAAPAPASRSDQLDTLSARELEVLGETLDGGKPSAIARRLCISPHTVRNHLKAIYRKLGVHSQLELLTRFRAAGAPAGRAQGGPARRAALEITG